MIATVEKLGDRLLGLVVPGVTAAATGCTDNYCTPCGSFAARICTRYCTPCTGWNRSCRTFGCRDFCGPC